MIFLCLFVKHPHFINIDLGCMRITIVDICIISYLFFIFQKQIQVPSVIIIVFEWTLLHICLFRCCLSKLQHYSCWFRLVRGPTATCTKLETVILEKLSLWKRSALIHQNLRAWNLWQEKLGYCKCWIIPISSSLKGWLLQECSIAFTWSLTLCSLTWQGLSLAPVGSLLNHRFLHYPN